MEKQQDVAFLMMANMTDQRLLRQFLEELGFLVNTSTAMLTEKEWLMSSIIILDEICAHRFGYPLLKIKRKSGPLFVPMVILLPSKSDNLPWLELGFDEVLRLPLRKAELLARVNMLMRLRVQSEIQYRLIFENINIGIYRLSADKRILFANKRFAQTIGYQSANEVINMSFKELRVVRKSSRKKIVKKIERIGESVSYESIWIRRDGREMYVIENNIAFNIDTGSTYYYASTVEDITERKLAQKALKQSEKKYRQLIEYSPYGILIQSDEHIVFANQMMIHLLGDSEPSALIGKPFSDRIHPDFRELFIQQIQFVTVKKRATSVIKEALLTVRGERLNVEVLACPVIYENKPAIQFIINDISARIRAEKQIEHMAYHDHLTGLVNRTKLEMTLGLALLAAHSGLKHVAVIFLDLDRFKSINDSLGHFNGDIILREVATRLKNATRNADTVSRVGGDEFIIVLADIYDTTAIIMSIVNKIKTALAKPILIDMHKLYVTASMGISIYPTDGMDATTLIKNADIAMYEAKKGGERKFKFCTPAMTQRAQEKTALEEKMREALSNHEFEVYYQPKLDILSGKISGVEALLRWKQTEGVLLPSAFIPLSEETGLIVPITEMVFTQVCQQIQIWHKEKHPPLDIAINLSGSSFVDHNFISVITRILKKYNIDPCTITLEITEGVLIQDIENNAQIIKKIKAMGMKISIDDFGTGYSSLNYLKCFIIDSLKIDISFVRDIATDPNDALIVSAIIAMAHSLKIKVIAEGVETKSQFDFLKHHACDEIQGFYFCKPSSPDALIHFIQQQK
ncbi:MAG TPA: GGDEF domain-containing protein [Legionella sp.]|nr:GGDEF domain-containing protein [Legionella sp.]